jgi:hypothetical protein
MKSFKELVFKAFEIFNMASKSFVLIKQSLFSAKLSLHRCGPKPLCFRIFRTQYRIHSISLFNRIFDRTQISERGKAEKIGVEDTEKEHCHACGCE